MFSILCIYVYVLMLPFELIILSVLDIDRCRGFIRLISYFLLSELLYIHVLVILLNICVPPFGTGLLSNPLILIDVGLRSR